MCHMLYKLVLYEYVWNNDTFNTTYVEHMKLIATNTQKT